MSKKIFIYLEPVDMDAENSENFHVIEARYDEEEEKFYFPKGYMTLDGLYEMNPKATILERQVHPYNHAHMRKFLAERQNEGEKVCANCVKRFYAENDKA